MDVLAAALSAIVPVTALFGVTTVVLLRQNGRLLLRMEALEARLSMDIQSDTGARQPD